MSELPQPGQGRTAERFVALWDLAAGSPSTGRLGEAHHDGVAILREAGRVPPDGATFGVWAAGGPNPVVLERGPAGLRLRGSKHWCSGASLVSHALITASEAGRSTSSLVCVEMATPGVTVCEPTWTSPAFAGVDTRTVAFDVALGDDAVVGTDDWYLRRPGFWWGAVGVAACWAGCAAGLVDRARTRWPRDAHALAHLGAVTADLAAMRAVLADAATQIDAAGPTDPDGHARALQVRHTVDLLVADVTTRVARALGPGPLAHDDDLHLVLIETDLFRRQCHGERDLA
ncbi:MAG: acyl-CoA dehydrogenase, partial [Actinobacteria bacterium]|nr:acyl-CoA dehydrogenase [Actinomycetota bacterium]